MPKHDIMNQIYQKNKKKCQTTTHDANIPSHAPYSIISRPTHKPILFVERGITRLNHNPCKLQKLHDVRTTGKELTAAMTSYKGEIT